MTPSGIEPAAFWLVAQYSLRNVSSTEYESSSSVQVTLQTFPIQQMSSDMSAVKKLSYERLNLNPVANVFPPNKIEECWQYLLTNETENEGYDIIYALFYFIFVALCVVQFIT
jgi:hypothetical protein